MVHESSPLCEVETQCCGHVQVLSYDYCHAVCLVEREKESGFVSSHAMVRGVAVVHCSV